MSKLSQIPNEKYQKLFDRFKEINTISVAEWRSLHLLSYFTKKYKETYNTDYAFKFNTPNPSKCFEIWQVNSLIAKTSSNPQIVKDYIDWVFINIVPKAKRKLTSISFLNNEETLTYYKMNIMFAGQTTNINRDTILPTNYKNILTTYNFNINNYGELAFLSQMEMKDNIKIVFEELIKLGLDKQILLKVI
jgi:hypothetical protein